MNTMKKTRSFLTAILTAAFVATLLPAQSFAFGTENLRVKNGPFLATQKKTEHATDRVVVKFKNDTEPFRIIALRDGETVSDTLKKYTERKDVEYAEPDYIAYADSVPNDPYYPSQWHMDNASGSGINAEEAWNITVGSPDVIVAVIDTGVAYETARRGRTTYYQAPDLANTCFIQGYDFVNNDEWANDDEGHGTHVTGTIAQSTNNNLGVAGIAPDTCIMPVKVLDKRGSGSYTAIANGIYYATDHGADVINMSLGGTIDSDTIKNAVAYAYGHGVTVVASAGNSASSVPNYPASYDEYVISVGATGYDMVRASYSSFGPSVDIAAPGGDFEDLNNDGYDDGVLQNTFGDSLSSFGYYFYMGTSMASPHVAGIAALLIANGNATTPNDVRTAIETTARDIGGQDLGHGLVDAYAALQWRTDPAVNLAPIANAGVDQTVELGSLVTLSASGSYDDHGIVDYAWDLGDGTTAHSITVDHTYVATGVYTATLTVTDGNGSTGTDTTLITVTEPMPIDVDLTSITATNVKAGLTYSVQASAMNNGVTSENVTFHLVIRDQNGTVVSWGTPADQTLTIASGATGSVLWKAKTDKRSLKGTYTANVSVLVDGNIVDSGTQTFTVY